MKCTPMHSGTTWRGLHQAGDERTDAPQSAVGGREDKELPTCYNVAAHISYCGGCSPKLPPGV